MIPAAPPSRFAKCTPKAHFVTIFAKPAGRPLVDDYVIDIPCEHRLNSPDMGAVFCTAGFQVVNQQLERSGNAGRCFIGYNVSYEYPRRLHE